MLILTSFASANLAADDVEECGVISGLYQEIVNQDDPSFDAVRFNEKLTNLLERMDGDKEWVIQTVNYAGSKDFKRNPILAIGLREWLGFLKIKNAEHLKSFEIAWESLVPAKKMEFIKELDRLINQSEYLQTDWVNPQPKFIENVALLTQSGLELSLAIKFIQVWKNLSAEGRRLMLYVTLRDNFSEVVKYVPLSVSTRKHQDLLVQKRETVRIPDPREKRWYLRKPKKFLTLNVQQDLAKIGEAFNAKQIPHKDFDSRLKSWIRKTKVLSPDDFYYLAHIRQAPSTDNYVGHSYGDTAGLNQKVLDVLLKHHRHGTTVDTRGLYLLMAAEKLSQPLSVPELETLLPKPHRRPELVLTFKELSEGGNNDS